MEHTEREHNLAVARRYLLRRWRTPVKVGSAVIASFGLVAFGADRLRTQKVEAASHLTPITAEGVVESLRVKGVGASFDGPVLELPVRKGQIVKKGDLLFRLDTRQIEGELAQAKADVAATWQALRDARSRRSEEIADAQREVRSLQRQIQREREQLAAAQQPSEVETVVTEDGEEIAVPEPAPVPVIDPSRFQELETRLAYARQQLHEVAASWEPVVQEAIRSHNAASQHVKSLRAMIAAATRRSPMDGVVTEVATRPGEWAAKGQPVVRVDDPSGFRVVTLVDQDIRSQAEASRTVTINAAGVQTPAQLEKVVNGEERELFYYYLWLKPENPRRLSPGQRVPVTVPATGQYTASL